MITNSQKEAVKVLLEAKMKKWKKPRVNISILNETINRHSSEKYYFTTDYQDFKSIFEEMYVNCSKPRFKLAEEGFLDRKKNYPFAIYQDPKVKSKVTEEDVRNSLNEEDEE